MLTLVGYGWPGNVRQLKNVIERLVIMAESPVLNSMDLLGAPAMGASLNGDTVPDSLEMLKQYKEQVLRQHYLHMEKAFLLKALEKLRGQHLPCRPESRHAALQLFGTDENPELVNPCGF
jgi:DNA-binding NtrC family response regulator